MEGWFSYRRAGQSLSHSEQKAASLDGEVVLTQLQGQGLIRKLRQGMRNSVGRHRCRQVEACWPVIRADVVL